MINKIKIELNGNLYTFNSIGDRGNYISKIFFNNDFYNVEFIYKENKLHNEHYYLPLEKHKFEVNANKELDNEVENLMNSLACKLNYYINGR
jgi:hypothetical protein